MREHDQAAAAAVVVHDADERSARFEDDARELHGRFFGLLRRSFGGSDRGSLGGSFGRAGSFYSTPAVAYGRVYLGSNDGRVYSFDKNTGELAWTYSTGDWVYSGPSVAQVPGTPPTVYIGSFDGNVYALNARSGEARWTFPMGGQVIGSLSVIGRTVYAATFDGTTTYGISAKSGRKVFEFHTGAYMPGISDGEKLYLVGYSSIHAMKPITLKQLRAERRAKEARKAARQKARKQAAQNQAGPSGQ